MISSKARRVRFNSRCKRAIEIGSGLNSCEGDIFRKPFYYFIPSLVAIVRGIYFTHEDRVSVR